MKRLKDPGRSGRAKTFRDVRRRTSEGRLVASTILTFIAMVAVGILAGCTGRKATEGRLPVGMAGRDTLQAEIQYARGFRMEKGETGTILVISNPLNPGSEIARYRLVPPGIKAQPVKGLIDISVPVKRLVASSTTHAGFLAAIGSGDRLAGCNNPERLYDTVLYKRFLNGELVQTGRDLSYNLEVLIATRPDLVLQTGIDGQFSPDARLTAAGIPVMFILEWMEPTPLGRAEWIKVFGRITGKSREADSLFKEIENRYLSLASKGKATREKVKVLTGNVFKGTWYMPGGRNYMTRFFEDAGMDYPWKDTETAGSLPLSFETVVYRMSDAPVWINVNVDSLSGLLASEKRYSVFRALKDHRVYSLSNRTNSHGGNDFWESGVVRPDRVLADLLAIAHPELEPGHVWSYYKLLNFNN